MSYPKIDKYDCDHCIKRNIDHKTEPCANAYHLEQNVIMSKNDFHMYQKAVKDIEWIINKIEPQLELLHNTSHMYKFINSILEKIK